ncbi:hypothetical protein CICLE_v10022627mg [Citrus x clementina]|uniref:Uncharacterized protein n=1 Tax=Citrus clementina TaxID=85681 RepID=V4TQ17_CITCL|nr:hypothetical protein CICLE_v10022627mg [Citrus x clementina]
MKVYAIALLACGSAIAFLVILRCLCSVGCKKKKTRYPPIPRSVTGPSSVAPRTYNTDVETGESAQGSGGKVSVLAGSAGVAAVATAAAVTIISSGGGGGGCGGGGCGGGGVWRRRVWWWRLRWWLRRVTLVNTNVFYAITNKALVSLCFLQYGGMLCFK